MTDYEQEGWIYGFRRESGYPFSMGALLWACSEAADRDMLGPSTPQELEWHPEQDCPTCRPPTAAERQKMFEALEYVCEEHYAGVNMVIDEIVVDEVSYDRGWHNPDHGGSHYGIGEFNFYDPAYNEPQTVAELLAHEYGHHLMKNETEPMAISFGYACVN